jgi:Sap, sulfolipid-1-addressing protein
MLRAMSVEAIILALAAAVRPSTSMAALGALLSRPRPGPPLAAFVIGGFAVSTAVGVIVVAGLHGVSLPGGRSDFAAIVDVVAGVACLGFAVGVRAGGIDRVRRNRERERDRPAWTTHLLEAPSLRLAAVAGVATHVPGVLYLVALNAIAAQQPGIGAAVFDVLLYNAIWFSVPVAALVTVWRRPDRARAAVDAMGRFVRRHDQALLVGVFAAVGVYLVVQGVVGLVS